MVSPKPKDRKGHLLGLHRVLDTRRCLPQEAQRLDNRLPIYNNELGISVERLNIDAASFRQMEETCRGNADAIGRIVLDNTRVRGKQHNAVTGSGGMLVGSVSEIGNDFPARRGIKHGDRVASLVSLTLTPLHIDRIVQVHTHNHQIEVVGHAILFGASIFAKMPKDLEENVAMAAFDVAGAPASVHALVRPKDTVVLIGAGGKAGLLSALAARKKMGRSGKIIGIEPNPKAAAELEALGLCHTVLSLDATDPVAVYDGIARQTRDKLADVVINVASAPDTELGTILSVRQSGKVLFFGMATSFSRVALGAEGVAKNATLLFGNGYRPGHSRFAIDLLRSHRRVLEVFTKRYR